jgi:hypothetical protein
MLTRPANVGGATRPRDAVVCRKPICGYVAGCMLYWAEGANNRNVLRFTNSEPAMVRLFVEFLRSYFDVADDRFRVWCNLYADHASRQREIEDVWLKTLRLPRSCLHKSTINSYSRYSARKRLNLLPYGTCRVSVGSTEIVQTIFGSIQELGGFERPDWLD